MLASSTALPPSFFLLFWGKVLHLEFTVSWRPVCQWAPGFFSFSLPRLGITGLPGFVIQVLEIQTQVLMLEREFFALKFLCMECTKNLPSFSLNLWVEFSFLFIGISISFQEVCLTIFSMRLCTVLYNINSICEIFIKMYQIGEWHKNNNPLVFFYNILQLDTSWCSAGIKMQPCARMNATYI